MQATSVFDRLKNRFDFVSEEPGYLAVVVLIAMFLAMTPKAGCTFQETEAPRPATAQSH